MGKFFVDTVTCRHLPTYVQISMFSSRLSPGSKFLGAQKKSTIIPENVGLGKFFEAVDRTCK